MTRISVAGREIDPHEQLRDLDRADAEDSLYEFFRQAWPFIDGATFSDSWAVDAIAEHLQAVADGDIKRLIINCPPRIGKSSCVSVAFPAWVWAQNTIGPISGPQVKFVGASYATQLSIRDSVKCRRLIESPWYQQRWGHRFKIFADQNTKSRFGNSAGGERLITSIDGTNTGEGGMCFVAGTMIAAPTCSVPIESLEIGNIVFAFDHEKQRIKRSKVVAVNKRKTNTLCSLFYGDKRLICTPDHKIFSVKRGYRPAFTMGSMDHVLFFGRFVRQGELDNVTTHTAPQVEVYDIQVEGYSNFFANDLLVHNCILIDDPNSVDDVDSEKTIQSAIDWWTGTMPTRLDDQKNGAYVIIQQRTFENDLTGYILETEADDWVHLMIPMRYEPERSFITTIGWKDPRTEPGELMDVQRFGEKEVARLERRLGPFRSAGQLQQRPEPAGGGIIKRSWWQLWAEDNFPPMDYICAMLDTAYTESTQNDPSALIVWGVFTPDSMAQSNRVIDRDGNIVTTDRIYHATSPKVMLMYAWSERLEFHDLVTKVAQTAKAMKIDVLRIENKASGISISQEIRRLYSDEKYSVQFYDPKSQDKMARLYSVQHLFADGLVFAPDRKWAEMVITQVGQFPAGKNDDLVDCTSMGMRHLRDMGLLARDSEREAEREDLHRYPERQQPLYPC